MMLVQITGKKNEEQLTTTSRIVAEVFGKEHSDVIKSIENLKEGIGKSSDTYFILLNKMNEQNKQYYKEYELTRDGYSSLINLGWSYEKIKEFIMQNQIKKLAC